MIARSDAEVRVVKMEVVAAAEHFERLAAEVSVVILVVERPGRDLGPRRLLVHELKIFLGDGTVDGAEGNVLMLAHGFFLEVIEARAV